MKRYVLPDGSELKNVHKDSRCAGRTCIIHNPTDHHMVDWRLHWRDDRAIFERICDHDIGHPDPDQFEFWTLYDMQAEGTHGCDGCCRTPNNDLGGNNEG